MRHRTQNNKQTYSATTQINYLRGTVVTGPQGNQDCLPLVAFQAENSSVSKQAGLVETMTDDVTPRSSKAFQFNACDHVKRFVDQMPQVSFVPKNGSVRSVRVSYNSTVCEDNPAAVYASTGPLSAAQALPIGTFDAYTANDVIPGEPTTDLLYGLESKAMSALSGFDSAVAFKESQDFPRMFDWFKKRSRIGGAIERLRSSALTSGLSSSRSARLKHYRQLIVGGQLNVMFGLLPTVSDIRRVVKELDDQKSRRIVVTVSNRDNFTGLPVSQKSMTNVMFPYLEHTLRATVQRTGGLRLSVDRPTYQSEAFRKAADYVERLTGANPLQSIWQMVPWSFVVDYLLSVDDLLDRAWVLSNPEFNSCYWVTRKVIREETIAAKYYGGFKPTRRLLTQPITPYSALLTDEQTIAIVNTYSRFTRSISSKPNLFQGYKIARKASPGRLYRSFLLALGLMH